ncbi:hypothetical protein ACQPZK_05210 [Micromonospora sp. CA-249363]|uniref:hypothetical protein n=1 Tax=Micromonospora sp. CA-249363 TaxID=3239963 RepID=UPI003D89DC5A
MTALAPPSWRLAWAERENERRQLAYRDATAAWRRRQDHLVRLRIEAASFLGCTQPRAGLPVDLDADELVFRVVPVATLVEAEARHVPGLPTPGRCSFAEPSSEALPPGLRAVDTGMALVTSHRVAFAGVEHRREWRYADLHGIAHHPDVPITLLHDDGRLSGLRVPANAAVNVSFYLTLAAASAAGDRGGFLGQLDALLATHQASPPVPLPAVGPSDAPLTAVRPDRRALAVAAIATVVFATLGPGAVGPSPTGPMRRAEAATMRDAGWSAPLPTRAALTGPSALVVESGSVVESGRLGGPALVVEPGSVAGPALVVEPGSVAGPALVVEPVRPPAAGPPRHAAASSVVAVPSTSPAAAAVRSTPPTAVAVPSPAAAVTPSASPTVEATPAPSGGPTPSSEPVPTILPTVSTPPTPTTTSDPALLTACLDPLLPLVERLLCPPAGP